MKDTGFWWGVTITFLIIKLTWGIGENGKYEDFTAKEWWSEATVWEDEFYGCRDDAYYYKNCVKSYVPEITKYCSL